MSLDIPYERLSPTLTVKYIPLKLALNDIPDTSGGGGEAANSKNSNDSPTAPKVNITVPEKRNYDTTVANSKQMYDVLVLGMLTVFCILVLLYAIYYFVILRDRQKPTEPRILMY
ncbi:AC78-like protein [Mythimna sequax nucleopolyhedrovirus]|nr:AC78-like protein [Mythimna sequax nucleopolyhedrovirus]